jgi:hypothetical protein
VIALAINASSAYPNIMSIHPEVVFKDGGAATHLGLGNHIRQAMSRRRFIRSAAFGALGTALAISADDVLAGVKESGEVVLDALMITYFSAPLGTTSSAFWTIETSYTTSLRLATDEPPDLVLKGRVSENDEGVLSNTFIKQTQSTQVKNAVTLLPRPSQNESFTSGTPSPGIPEHTVFYGMLKPRLQLVGTPSKLKFWFLEAEGEFTVTASSVRSGTLEISADTALSWLRQYVIDPADLIAPRFVRAARASSGELSITRSAGDTSSDSLSAVTTARIIEQTGFRSDEIKRALAVGRNLQITYSSAEELLGKLLTVSSPLERRSPGVNEVYWDRVFKTFVIIDA